MTSNSKISVAMAAYNGEKYIREQLDSVLAQLSDNDELIVSLDPSTDGTESILQEIAKSDPRLKILQGPASGVVKNFENALQSCTGDILFLCDQDDKWFSDKVKECTSALSGDGVLAAMHDASIVDRDMQVVEPSFMKIKNTGTGIRKNMIRNTYIGCCMAFKKELLPYVLPFPDSLPMHDQWIGILGEKFGKVRLIRKPLVYYRRHGENASGDTHSSLLQMMRWRLSLIREYRKRVKEVAGNSG